MTDRQVPRMMRGGLSGRIYVVTRYRDLGNGSVEALQKYDVTEQFDATFHVDHERAVKAEAQIAAVREAIEELRTNAGIVADAGDHALAYSYRDDADRIQRALDAQPE